MDALWQELTSGLHDSKQLSHVIIRLVAPPCLAQLWDSNESAPGNPPACERIS